MSPNLALNPMERLETMLNELYAPNNLYGHGLGLLACFLRIRQKLPQIGKKKARSDPYRLCLPASLKSTWQVRDTIASISSPI